MGLGFWLGACAPSPPAAPTYPNAPVLLISIDTLRADHLPAYGYRDVETPAIDGLRRDGVRFANAYCSVPLTLPSHAALLTGLPPYQNGVRDNIGYRLGPQTITLPSFLRQHGYAAGAVVSAYVLRGSTGLAASFDDYEDRVEVTAQRSLGELERPGAESAALAIAWIDAHRAKPWFLFLHLYEPHAPYQPPEPWKSRYASRPYDGEIATADAAVGKVLDHLRAAREYERSMVILLSDHGEGLGEHGEKEHGVLLYRDTLHVPLLVKLPGARLAGATIAEPAALVDVFPTVAALVGLKTPPGLGGRSLFALAGAPRRLYSETLYPRLHLGWSDLHALTDARWSYIEGPDPELYDLRQDPDQSANVLLRERRVGSQMRADMKSELAASASVLEPPQASTAEEAKKLAALGYLTQTVQAPAGPLADPKRAIPDLKTLSQAYDLGAAGDHVGALELLRPLVERYPAMLDARFQLASNLAATGQYKEALAHYDRAIATAPAAAPGLLTEKARVELKMARLDEAERDARAALAAQPEEAHEVLARVAWARGDVATASREAQAAVTADTAPRAEALVLWAEMLQRQGHWDTALGKLDPLHAEIEAGRRHPVAGLEFLRGDALARAARNDEAEFAFRAEMKYFPKDGRAYSGLAFLLASQHRFGEIDPVLQGMIAANPSRESILAAASAYDSLGDARTARSLRDRAGRLGGSR